MHPQPQHVIPGPLILLTASPVRLSSAIYPPAGSLPGIQLTFSLSDGHRLVRVAVSEALSYGAQAAWLS